MKPLTFSVSYDRIVLNATRTAYDTAHPVKAPPRHALVLLVRYAAAGGAATVVSASTVGTDGSVTLDVPTKLTAQDYVVLSTVGYDNADGFAGFAVLEPSVDGVLPVVPSEALTGQPHSWAKTAVTIAASGSWHIGLANAAATLQAYEDVAYTWTTAAEHAWGVRGKTLVVWLRNNTKFDCGTCFSDWPVTVPVLAKQVQTQIYASTSAKGRVASPTMQHELGHWAMATYGTSPGEGARTTCTPKCHRAWPGAKAGRRSFPPWHEAMRTTTRWRTPTCSG